jgi:hypothetical protein
MYISKYGQFVTIMQQCLCVHVLLCRVAAAWLMTVSEQVHARPAQLMVYATRIYRMLV